MTRGARPAPRADQRQWLAWALLLAPSAVVLVPFYFGPLVITLVFSVYRFVPGGRMEPALVADNYTRFIFDDLYRHVLIDTLLMGLAVTCLALVLTYPLAYTVARSRSRWRGLLIVAVLVPLMSSVVVRSYGWTILLANHGIINTFLALIGVDPVKLLFTFSGAVVALTEVLMPFMFLTLLGVLQNVDHALEEAVQSLGGGRWCIFRDVLLPLSLPGVAAGSLLVFALSISAFATPKLVGGAGTQVMATLVYDQTVSSLNWPFASATSVIVMVLALVLTVVQGRLLRRRRAWTA